MKKCPKGHSYNEKLHDCCPVCSPDTIKKFSVSKNITACVYGPPKNRSDVKIHMIPKNDKHK